MRAELLMQLMGDKAYPYIYDRSRNMELKDAERYHAGGASDRREEVRRSQPRGYVNQIPKLRTATNDADDGALPPPKLTPPMTAAAKAEKMIP